VPQVNYQQAIFNKGEITPKLHARADADQYAAGLAACRNFHVLVHGGVSKRSGTLYCGKSLKAPASTFASRLIPFVFSATQGYILEFSHLKLGFARGGGLIATGPVRYTIDSPYAEADLAGISYVQSADVVYLVHRDYPIHKLARFGEINWTLTPLHLDNGPWLDVNVKENACTPTGIGKPAITVAPIPGDLEPTSEILDGNKATFWRSTKNPPATLPLVFTLATPLACAGYTVQALVNKERTGLEATNVPTTVPRSWYFEGNTPTGWVVLDRRIAETDWQNGEVREYYFTSDRICSQYRLTITSDNGSKWGTYIAEVMLYLKDRPGTLIFDNTTNINGDAGFTDDDIGRQIRWQGTDGFWRVFTITGVNSPVSLSGTWDGFWAYVLDGSQTWALGAFSEASGYPSSVTLYQSRLCFAGTKSKPRTVYMSWSDDFERFEIPDPLTDDAPITVTIAGERHDAINWLEEAEDLLMIGTSDSIVSVGGTESNVISPTNIRQRVHTGFGSTPNTLPIRAGAVILFIGNHNTCVRELMYSSQANGYDANDIAVLADHLYKPGVFDLAFGQSPLDTAYMVSNNGTVIGVVYESAQQVVGHSVLEFEGGKVKSLAIIPEDGADTLYFVMERVIDGVPVHYIERMQPFFNYDTDADAWFLDSALKYSGPATKTISGLDHLEGEVVQVYNRTLGPTPVSTPTSLSITGDIAITYTVRNGEIILPLPVSECVVGIPMLAYIRLLHYAVNGPDGSSYGRLSTTDSVLVALLNSRAVRVRASPQLPSDPLTLRKGEDPMNTLAPLFTGVSKVPIDSSWMIPDALEFISDTPHPCTILSVTSAVDSEPGNARKQGG
jgi:hypothetical protein